MPITPTELNAIVDYAAARGTYVSLHTADPGTTGANECTGGSPAYARKQTTWGAASGSPSSAVGSQITFDLLGQATHFGLWSAVTAGTFRGGNALPATIGTAAVQTTQAIIPTYGPFTGLT
jgi:hypothetical protein